MYDYSSNCRLDAIGSRLTQPHPTPFWKTKKGKKRNRKKRVDFSIDCAVLSCPVAVAAVVVAAAVVTTTSSSW